MNLTIGPVFSSKNRPVSTYSVIMNEEDEFADLVSNHFPN